MAFIAKDKETGKRIDITLVKLPKIELPAGSCVCPLCDEPLLVRSAYVRENRFTVRAHFAHYGETCNAPYDRHPESPEHHAGKLEVARYLLDLFGKTVKIELEVPVAMDWRAKGRVADVMLTWPGGQREAHEIQLAAITEDEIKERTRDYLRAQMDVAWWIGGRAADNVNVRRYLEDTFGYVHVLSFHHDVQTDRIALPGQREH